ncbi:hypothetical protein SAMN05216249_10762 [Acetitomaculum ruminis DSM 5522]|uniref:Uncharacterized protein n=1 Tax=Acetitomaculum ruminis DSM 5522 TaxID=1120918 RepID=A0A1I0XQB0_9FIRM|nr:hypothetical protein [Acetitomaculum ruminis]SFB02867.1 hypothetical protein SAMN05216249_10762 [Acetitomaculum ruminis DSM 5522]
MKIKNSYPLNGIRLCIDLEDNVNCKGRAYSPLRAEPLIFNDMNGFFVEMDKVFDKAGYPQAFQEKRTFDGKTIPQGSFKNEKEAKIDDEFIEIQYGEQKTFDVIVDTRYNTSWQGKVLDTEGKMVGSFDGELELYKLI